MQKHEAFSESPLGEETTLTVATSKSKSLRSTVPISIVRQFRLKEGDRLEWQFEAREGEMIIIVRPKIAAGIPMGSAKRSTRLRKENP